MGDDDADGGDDQEVERCFKFLPSEPMYAHGQQNHGRTQAAVAQCFDQFDEKVDRRSAEAGQVAAPAEEEPECRHEHQRLVLPGIHLAPHHVGHHVFQLLGIGCFQCPVDGGTGAIDHSIGCGFGYIVDERVVEFGEQFETGNGSRKNEDEQDFFLKPVYQFAGFPPQFGVAAT